MITFSQAKYSPLFCCFRDTLDLGERKLRENHLLVFVVSLVIQRARRDLNPRPTEPESVALSTELRAHDFP